MLGVVFPMPLLAPSSGLLLPQAAVCLPSSFEPQVQQTALVSLCSEALTSALISVPTLHGWAHFSLVVYCFRLLHLTLLLLRTRTVISDEESVSVIAQCASSAGIDDAEAPMFDEDVTMWGEFKKMRHMIQHTGFLCFHVSMFFRFGRAVASGLFCRSGCGRA